MSLARFAPQVDRIGTVADDPQAIEMLYDDAGHAYAVPTDWHAGLTPRDGHSADDRDSWPPDEDLGGWGMDPFADDDTEGAGR